MKTFMTEEIIARNKGKIYDGVIYSADAALSKDARPAMVKPRLMIAGDQRYTNSAGRSRYLAARVEPLRRKLIEGKEKNAATGYDAATLAEFAAVTMVDIQRIADELVDYTQTMYNVTVNPEATAEIKIRDLLPHTVVPGKLSGTGDLAPLMEHRTPIVEEIILDIYGFGDKSMLREILWSPNYNQIAESAARAIADYRNSLVFDDMVKASYDAAHSVTASAVSGQSNDEANYAAVKAAYKKAVQLVNPLTNRKLDRGSFETSLYVNKADEIDLKPIVDGALAGVGGVRMIAQALPIDNFVSYSGGLQDGDAYMGAAASFPGVASGTAYLLIKTRDGAQLIRKIDWQPEFQAGQMRIKGEERYWWTVYGKYNANILPQTVGGVAEGAIIKITLV